MSEDVRRLVGGNVKRLRMAAGITQAELAELVGVDRAYISGLEQGNRNATIVSLWHVAQALEAPIRSLFDEAKKSR
ncbi:helix-turn-helix transcriptional regulator [Bradyrhizobium diazoefficiens]|nr:helix-turn-helix transcriptional regulator [Bradyrhizobium diazoefficiens]QQO19478.1 helix-turn-helix transcriptional regulator [Bradyrhizobium diazoefficiens]